MESQYGWSPTAPPPSLAGIPGPAHRGRGSGVLNLRMPECRRKCTEGGHHSQPVQILPPPCAGTPEERSVGVAVLRKRDVFTRAGEGRG